MSHRLCKEGTDDGRANATGCIWSLLGTEVGRRCNLDPSLKAHLVSNFDCGKDITVLST